ncbi:MAG: ABC transporter substrate-binding protein [Tissierellia bacterium]|nr:ABC transporter substrate-binding protein [Tissierellia bacterium]
MKRILAFLLALVMIFSITACTGKEKEEAALEVTEVETEEATEEAKEEETPEPEKVDFTGRTMNVVATSDKYVTLFDKFTQETGAKVEFLSMSSGEVLSRVEAEGGTPMADLWFGGGLDAFMDAKAKGFLESFEVPEAADVPAEYKDPEGFWYSKGLTVVGFLLNDKVIAEKGFKAPETWADLADPIYKDEIIMSNPAISGTNYAAVKGIIDMMGEDAAWDYFAKLNDNIPYYGKRGKDPQEKTVAGEFAIGIIPVDKSAFDAAAENGLTVVYPTDGIPWVPEGVAVFKGSENADVAKEFVNFMLRPDNQQIVAELDGKDSAQLIKPGVEGLSLGLPQDKLVKQELATFGEQREAILNRWKELTGDK